MMDTGDIRGKWIIGSYDENTHNDDFITKNRMPEYADDNERYRFPPNPVKSQAEIILTEMEKQLQATESRYDSAKERLRYSQMLYHTAGSISLGTNDFKQIHELPISAKNSLDEISSNLCYIDENNAENNLAFGDTRYLTDATKEKQKAQIEIEATDDGAMYTSRLYKDSRGFDTFRNDHYEYSHDLDIQNHSSEQTRDSRQRLSSEEFSGNAGTDKFSKIRDNHLINDTTTRNLHPYQLNLMEYSKGLQDEFEEESRHAESPKPEDPEISSSDKKSSGQLKPAKEKFQLILSESVASFQHSLKSKKSRIEKRRRASGSVTSTKKTIMVKQIDDTVGATSRRKRKKKGLKAYNSRCTTATRDTSLPENKKDIKKRSLRGHSTIRSVHSSDNRHHEMATKIQQNFSEFVEIYHNGAVNSGTISVVSSKHSKLMDPRDRGTVNTAKPVRIRGSHRLVDNKKQINVRDDNEERKSRKQKNHQRITNVIENVENCDENGEENVEDVTDLRFEDLGKTFQTYQEECHPEKNDIKTINEYRAHCHNRNENCSQYYDPLSMRNYELPTVASRLKQVNRSYFNRFNFRNIPFVVGTSTTPSYNLGLNIQEALSLIKTRQLMPGGVAPLLISKVAKGMGPVATLLGNIKDSGDTQPEESNIRFNLKSTGICSVYPDQISRQDVVPTSVQLRSFPVQTPRLNCLTGNQRFYEAEQACPDGKIEMGSKKRQTQSTCSIKFNSRRKVKDQSEREFNTGDFQSTKWQNVVQNGKGIRDVLVNFHDQFEAMNIRYEKLQEQFEKTKDKSLEQEMASLEKELNAKEEEINAVAGLWMEVMALKQQMRMLHERNSLVCVATESPISPTYHHQLTTRAQTTNPIRMINLFKRSGSANNNRGPSTSTRLAGLLRQIKTFQKQLKSNA